MSSQLAFLPARPAPEPEDDVSASLIELLMFSGGELPQLSQDEVSTLIAALRAYSGAAAEIGIEPSVAPPQEHLF